MSSTSHGIIICFLYLICSSTEAGKVKEGKETWGYVNIRENANTFWWLYYSTVNGSYLDVPLILWLQGGPGASSTGYGNFNELGVLDIDLQPRDTNWVQSANVLFVDNPVGSGFSYVTNKTAYATNNTQIANDLLAFITDFLKKLPEFQKVPLYIFSESYGGKMAIAFAKTLNEAIAAQKIICNFKGVAMGDSWISPIDSVLSWGSYLYSTSLVDSAGLMKINAAASGVKDAISKGDWKKATELFDATQDVIDKETNGVNFYNILKESEAELENATTAFKEDYLNKLYRQQVLNFQDDKLSKLMNGKIKEKLHKIPANVTWGGQSADVFQALANDFMTPVTDVVEELLNKTRLSVVVYTGQLDLIVDTLGTDSWIQKLKWLGLKPFNNSTRTPISIPKDNTAGFVKSFKNFAMYWILNSGHMVPRDAGEAALKMLNMVVKNKP